MQTLLVTGHGGFVGRAVTAACESASRWRAASLPPGLDIRARELASHIAGRPPDGVLHLAARTSVAESFGDPDGYFDVNFHGTQNLLRALRETGFAGRFLYVSSGDCYGAVDPAALPINECQPLRPRSPYAVSKTAAEALCYQWSQTERLQIVIARPFNHIGPGQDARFATASFARQIARIRCGLQAPRIVCGDLDVTRDLTDVRDVADAYFALLDKGESGEVYNIGSGRETRMRDVLDDLLAIAGVEVEIMRDPQRMRREEQRRAVADVRKIAAQTGWHARRGLASTLKDMLDDWMDRGAHE